jgi:hypothetical protein
LTLSRFSDTLQPHLIEGVNPIEITTQLAQEKKIVIRPVKGGVMLLRNMSTSSLSRFGQGGSLPRKLEAEGGEIFSA